MSQPKIQPSLSLLALQLRFALAGTALALVVIMLGAWVRLSDAGLGCPDWPGCYGQLIVPSEQQEIAVANSSFPERPLDRARAWKEMTHRYLAGTLGLIVAALAWLAWRCRRLPDQPKVLPALLLGTVIFQALLGMWTVTLLVKPLIVTAHLLGGLATLSMLWLLSLNLLRRGTGTPAVAPTACSVRLLPVTAAVLMVLIAQIFLGGWTSTNYAAIGCTEFPSCNNGDWWPETDFSEAFVLWRGLGINYEFGVLEYPARTAIHLSHRIGALITAICLGLLGWRLTRSDRPVPVRRAGHLLLALLLLQLGLGITNVLAQLPLPVAVAHNGVAALLLLVMLTIIWLLTPADSRQRGYQRAEAGSANAG